MTKIKIISVVLALLIAVSSVAVFSGCNQDKSDKAQAGTASTDGEYFTNQEVRDSPAWVTKLDAAKSADQLFVVAAHEKTTAWVSLHEKDKDGKWQMVMSTPGYIGKNGLGKTKEGDGKTPVGTFGFNAAFGIASDPGCSIPYTKVDDNTY